MISHAEKRIPLKSICNRLQSQPAWNTVRRWTMDGMVNKHTGKRIRLACVQEGATIYTSWEAYLRFEEALNSQDDLPSVDM